MFIWILLCILFRPVAIFADYSELSKLADDANRNIDDADDSSFECKDLVRLFDDDTMNRGDVEDSWTDDDALLSNWPRGRFGKRDIRERRIVKAWNYQRKRFLQILHGIFTDLLFLCREQAIIPDETRGNQFRHLEKLRLRSGETRQFTELRKGFEKRGKGDDRFSNYEILGRHGKKEIISAKGKEEGRKRADELTSVEKLRFLRGIEGIKPRNRRFGKREESILAPHGRRFGKRNIKNEESGNAIEAPRNRRFGKREDMLEYTQRRRFGRGSQGNDEIRELDGAPKNRRFGKRDSFTSKFGYSGRDFIRNYDTEKRTATRFENAFSNSARGKKRSDNDARDLSDMEADSKNSQAQLSKKESKEGEKLMG